MPPIPSQFVNERPIDANVGNQISPPTTTSGMPAMSVSARRWRPDRRTARPLRRAPATSTLGATSVAIASRPSTCSRSEDCDLLLLDAADETVHVVRLVEELLQAGDNTRGAQC